MENANRTVTGIECPVCGGGTRVAVTLNFVTFIRRQRVCKNAACGHSFYTMEMIARETPKDGPDRKNR